MIKKFGYVVMATMMFGTCTSRALADTIDEQYKEFLSQLNVAKNRRQISSKQASELDHDMHEFSRLKRELRENHADVVTTEDEAKLNKILNDAAQKLEMMTGNKVPTEKNKAPTKE